MKVEIKEDSQNSKISQHSCEYCTYGWFPRVESPKSCPRCKRRFDYKDIREVFQTLKREILGIES
ncbi:hypothetical protein HYV79_00720 [Candidatus Woesearchaeota archaeon]|nr:hypothetical protein [Candidatus Woesearchaeota archaeon]